MNEYNTSSSWIILNEIEYQIKRKIESIGTPLSNWNININRGIITGLNEAFIISEEIKNELIEKDPKSAEIIRPIIRGKDIKKYQYNFANLWLINVHNGIKEKGVSPINIELYPAVKEHLNQYYDKLVSRADKGDTPYNLRNCVYMDDFFKPKIVYREISTNMNACMVEPGIMLNNKCYFITGEHLSFLLAYFNSTIFNKIILLQANATGGKGESFLHSISAIKPSAELEEKIRGLLNKLYDTTNNLEKEKILYDIDLVFYNLYGLSSEEVNYLSTII